MPQAVLHNGKLSVNKTGDFFIFMEVLGRTEEKRLVLWKRISKSSEKQSFSEVAPALTYEREGAR